MKSPVTVTRLVERVKAILRRARQAPSQQSTALINIDGLELDSEKRTVSRDSRQIALTSLEYKLLYALMNSPGKAFSRDELLDHCHRNGVSVIDRVIDVHIGKLRQKIEHDPSNPRYILTVRGYGYRFSDDGGRR